MNTRTGLTIVLVSALSMIVLASTPAVAATYYVDGNDGLAGNGGTSWADAKQTLLQAYGLLSDGTANLVLVRGDYQYTTFNSIGSKGGASDTERIIWRGVPGTSMGLQPILDGSVAIAESSYQQAPGSNVYWVAYVQIRGVWEGALGGEWGFDWDTYTLAGSLAACDSTQGSYYWSDETVDKLYIHTSDSSDPTNFIIKESAQRYDLVDKPYITFEGFVGRHNKYNPLLPWYDTAEGITFFSNTFHHIESSGGIRLRTSHNNKVISNTVFACNTYGISVETAGTNTYIYGNTVYSNAVSGIYLNSTAHGSVVRDNVCYDNTGDNIYSAGADNCDIYGNVCSGAGDDEIYMSSSTNTTVYGNVCSGANDDGIYMLNSPDSTLSNNTIHDVGDEGIYAQSSPRIVIRDNVVHDCADRGIDFDPSTDGKIHGNTFHNCTGFAIYCDDGAGTDLYGNTIYSNTSVGIYMDSSADDSTIYDNTLYDNGGTHIFLSSADNGVIYNNVVSGGSGGSGIYVSSSTGCSVYNNTVYGMGGNGDALAFGGTCDPTKVFNNNLWAVGAATRQCIFTTAAAQTGFSSDYNNIYYTDGGRAGEWGAPKSTLLDWQTSSNQDSNSITANPLFIDTASTPPDLHLALAASPCVGIGVASFSGVNAPSTDIDGDARPLEGSYDIGADEYVPAGSMFMIR